MIDAKVGSGHPLPESEEAREDLVPEQLVERKGHGEDERRPSRAEEGHVEPDGTPYPGGD